MPTRGLTDEIAHVEADRAAWQYQLAHAAATRRRAQHLADSARAAEDQARAHVRDDDQTLEQLREQLDEATVPPPRIPR